MELTLTEYSNIIYVGDLHGGFNEFVQSTKDCTNSLYILTGDLGLGYKKRDIEIDDFSKAEYILASNNNYVIIIRGNNDNPAYFKKKSGYRNDVLYDSPHIILVPDYSIIYTKNHIKIHISEEKNHANSHYRIWISRKHYRLFSCKRRYS